MLETLIIVASLLITGTLLVGVVLTVRDTIRRKGNFGINIWPTRCRSCGEDPPTVRTPQNLRQTLWGGWTCPQCGVEVDKWGEPVADARTRKAPDDIRRGGDFRD